MQQVLSSTVSGQRCTPELLVLAAPNTSTPPANTNNISVSWNGSALLPRWAAPTTRRHPPLAAVIYTVVGIGADTPASAASGAWDNYGGSLDNVSVTAVPEPETFAMLLAGLGLMGAGGAPAQSCPDGFSRTQENPAAAGLFIAAAFRSSRAVHSPPFIRRCSFAAVHLRFRPASRAFAQRFPILRGSFAQPSAISPRRIALAFLCIPRNCSMAAPTAGQVARQCGEFLEAALVAALTSRSMWLASSSKLRPLRSPGCQQAVPVRDDRRILAQEIPDLAPAACSSCQRYSGLAAAKARDRPASSRPLPRGVLRPRPRHRSARPSSRPAASPPTCAPHYRCRHRQPEGTVSAERPAPRRTASGTPGDGSRAGAATGKPAAPHRPRRSPPKPRPDTACPAWKTIEAGPARPAPRGRSPKARGPNMRSTSCPPSHSAHMLRPRCSTPEMQEQ